MSSEGGGILPQPKRVPTPALRPARASPDKPFRTNETKDGRTGTKARRRNQRSAAAEEANKRAKASERQPAAKSS